ncbi:hypothetical protein PC112_g19121 [Phytophthora cactorum]|nr:hypothetical protein PC112_g19121 [Phytophthora cactorum]KAG3133897.1 hypothetical protein C6341_g22364 [Phytophthora cactorum]
MGSSAVLFVTDPACPRTTKQVLESLSQSVNTDRRWACHWPRLRLDFAHGELDGEATFIFGKVWAQRYRRLAGIPSNELKALIKLNHDRHFLSGHGNEVSVAHPEFRVASPQW